MFMGLVELIHFATRQAKSVMINMFEYKKK